MAFCEQFSRLRYRTFVSLEKGKFVFQKSLSETPFRLDRVSFALPNFCGKIDRKCLVAKRVLGQDEIGR